MSKIPGTAGVEVCDWCGATRAMKGNSEVDRYERYELGWRTVSTGSDLCRECCKHRQTALDTARRAWDRVAKSILASVDECEDATAVRAGDGWDGEIFGFCPVQGLGHVDGFSWYFRARWEEWRFEVYDAPFRCDGGGRRLPDADPFFEVGGDADGDASWMPFSEAWRHIESSIVAFRAREATQ